MENLVLLQDRETEVRGSEDPTVQLRRRQERWVERSAGVPSDVQRNNH